MGRKGTKRTEETGRSTKIRTRGVLRVELKGKGEEYKGQGGWGGN